MATTTGVATQVSRTTMFYDTLDRMTAQVGNMGNVTDYRYNSLGQVVAMGDSRSTTPSLRTFYRRGDTAEMAVSAKTSAYHSIVEQKMREDAVMAIWYCDLLVSARSRIQFKQ